jgi:hypothetical protein
MSLITDQWMDSMRIRLPGALDGAILIETWNAAEELCRTAFVWRQTLEVPLDTDTALYEIPTQDTIVAFLEIAHETMNVDDVLVDDRTRSLVLPAPPAPDDLNTPIFLTTVLSPAPQNPIVLDDMLPDDVWVACHDVLRDGVLSRMMSQPAKPYSNVALATFHGRRFRSGMAVLRNLTNTGRVPEAQNWRFPKWA